MGKKAKLGKARKDRFYKLAKETGYRSRAAFKLIQLNRKFEFLQKSRVVVDLCAAPGGWLQVAAENTPVSSLVIGVDLVPIRPIPKTICLQNDITTESCRQAIKKELQTWQVDTVLNDGAPNVGKSWVHDSFQQAQLTLSALKLATGVLRKGGWFVTKLFRSKDYNSLLWVFHQLFKKVHATKPQASRNESAEIFVVCESYLAPDKLDQRFLDPRHVFKELEEDITFSINAFKPEQKQRNREGYPEGVTSLNFVKNVTDFINSENYLQILASSSVLKFDDESIENNPLTTDEIKNCCQDIRVLGKKDIKRLISWRKSLHKEKEDAEKKDEVTEEVVESDEEDEELKLEELLATAKEEEKKQIKKRLKKIRERKIKLTHRMDLKMEHPEDVIEQVDDISLFDLKKINTKKALDEVQKGDLSMMDVGDIIQDDDIYIPKERPKKIIRKDKADYDYDIDSDNNNPDEDDDISMAEISSDGENKDEADLDINGQVEEENPLLVPLDNKKTVSQRVEDWFNKDSFAGLIAKDSDDDDGFSSEEEEISKVDKENLNQTNQRLKKSKAKSGNQSETDDISQNENDDSDVDEDVVDDDDDDDDEFDDDNDLDKELVTKKVQKRAAPELDAEGLAIAAKMVQSKKQKRDIVELGYNRYMTDDTNLPMWFLKEEEKHYKKNAPVTKAEVQEYKEMMKAVDARPIKKVAEAKARKKLRSAKKLEKVRKKAETITDAVDTSEREKWMKIKDIYKKAGLLGKKKKEISYVVAKRGGGTRGSKPKGPFKVVDKRLKKDKRSTKANAKRKEKNKKRR